MNSFALIFYFVFGGNVLITWGIVPCRDQAVGIRRSWIGALSIFLASIPASLIDSFLYRRLLTPLGLESMEPLVFGLFLFGVYFSFSAAASALGKPLQAPTDEGTKTIPWSLALYVVALSVGERFSSPLSLMVAGGVAAFGFIAATVLLDDIMARLDLESVPEVFRGMPARFISAGLIALAFSGVDAAFFSRLFE